jgi:hypothetical protein
MFKMGWLWRSRFLISLMGAILQEGEWPYLMELKVKIVKEEKKLEGENGS